MSQSGLSLSLSLSLCSNQDGGGGGIRIFIYLNTILRREEQSEYGDGKWNG